MKRVFYILVLGSFLILLSFASCGEKENTEESRDNETWVDLGLPSGVLWASCNIGSSTPAEIGDYFAWGEVEPKSKYDWDTYKHGGYKKLIKYCYDSQFGLNGFVDGLRKLLPNDDVATVVLGSGAHIPTIDEWRELMAYTTCESTVQDDVFGRRFTGSNGKSIFIPAAGYKQGTALSGSGEKCCYWTNSLNETATDFANYYGYERYGYHQSIYSRVRCLGFSVRAVRTP